MPTSLRVRGGGQSKTLSLRVGKAVRPTTGDLLVMVATQQSRILSRTERGVDFEGKRFAAYSRRGPYYYYPSGPVHQTRSVSQIRGAKARLTRSLRGVRSPRNGVRTRSGLGLRFASYDAFKRGFLGRTNVDLRGARAPHMLQQIALQVGNRASGPGGNPSRYLALAANAEPQPVTRATLGIYGEAGARAEGHNEGTRHLPRRRFFDVSEKDLDAAAELLADRSMKRLLAALDSR